jgi:hypothetical protein
MTDYLGNEIKEGMTIQVIETEPFFSKMTLCILHTGTGMREQVEDTVMFPDKWWHVKGEYEIVSIKDKLFYEHKVGEMIWSTDISLLSFGLQTSDIITIKGVSDINPN